MNSTTTQAARELADALYRNATDLEEGRITHEQHGQRDHETWNAIFDADMVDDVLAVMREW